jgi:hypothetical protein
MAKKNPELKKVAFDLFISALESSTHATYASHWRDWAVFNETRQGGDAWDAKEDRLVLWVAWRAKLKINRRTKKPGLAYSTIRTGIFAIKSILRRAGFIVTIKDMYMLKEIVKAVRKLGSNQVVRKPLTIDLLRELLDALGDSKDDRAIAAAWALAVLALLRTSEFLVDAKRNPCPIRMLRVGSIEWVPSAKNPLYIRLRLRYTKTDLWRTDQIMIVGLTPNFRGILAVRDHLVGQCSEKRSKHCGGTIWRL